MHATHSHAAPPAARATDLPEVGAARPVLELLVDFDAAPATHAVPVLAYGSVVEAAPLRVAVDGRARGAKRAKSCLVAPEPGDRVLCSLDGATAYVLAVLDGAADTRVVADGKLEVRADELALAGRRVGVEGAEVAIHAGALRMHAQSAVAALEELRLLGRSLEANVADKVVLFAERVEARASRLLTRAKHAFRFVEGLEQVRAGHYDLRAEGLAALRGENTILAARVLAKLDGEQVKIG
ncbi:MAG: DUF3540 domain-containing protein [Polyangiaceae bacterium]|nr:DUF3540 domain-containing protein [Polyangiaceae bacterium]